MLCKDRLGNVVIGEGSQDRILKKMYGSIPGRAFLHIFTKPIISKAVGMFLSTGLTSRLIPYFIKGGKRRES